MRVRLFFGNFYSGGNKSRFWKLFKSPKNIFEKEDTVLGKKYSFIAKWKYLNFTILIFIIRNNEMRKRTKKNLDFNVLKKYHNFFFLRLSRKSWRPKTWLSSIMYSKKRPSICKSSWSYGMRTSKLWVSLTKTSSGGWRTAPRRPWTWAWLRVWPIAMGNLRTFRLFGLLSQQLNVFRFRVLKN